MVGRQLRILKNSTVPTLVLKQLVTRAKLHNTFILRLLVLLGKLRARACLASTYLGT